MKLYFSLALTILVSSAFARQPLKPTTSSETLQSNINALETINDNNWFKGRTYDTVYRDLQKTFYVTKSELKDKKKIDSLFGLSKYYLSEAIKEGYNRIVITIITGKGVLKKGKERAFRCDWLYEQVTGKKLPVVVYRIE